MASKVVTFRLGENSGHRKNPLSWDYEGPKRLADKAHRLLEIHLPDVSMEVKTIRFPVN